MPRPLEFSESEWSTRIDLAALYRLSVRYGWTDLTSTHISARLPDDPEHYLINSYDLMFDEITASNLSKVSFSGEMKTPGRVRNTAGHVIHSSILRARPELNFVMHSHTRAGVAVSAVPGGLRPLSQHAGRILGTLSTHRYSGFATSAEEGEVLVSDLGQNYAMLLENHGLLVAGRTPGEAFILHYYVEMACRMQVDILSQTDDPIEIEPEALAPLIEWGRPSDIPLGAVQWQALIRLLEREHPGFRD
jgi:ribulose-5-phosphate 4-epimerase/fuculose-1-phosphate aldolase